MPIINWVIIIAQYFTMTQLEQIATSLMKTCENNTAIIKEAEGQLEKLSQTENFASLLLTIPQMEGVSRTKVISQAAELSRVATIYMLKYARNLVLWRNQAMINIAAQQMLEFVSKNSIDFKHKDQVGAALQYLIQKDQNNVIVFAFLSNMTEILRGALQSQPNQINFEFIAIMSEALADKVVPATGEQAQKYIYQSFICLCSLISKILGVANNFMSSDISIVEKALLLSTKMLKTLKKYIKKFMYFNSKVTQTVHMPQFLALIKEVLNFNLPENTLSLPIFYLGTKEQLGSKLLQYFHSIKSIAIYILTQSLRVVIYSNNSSGQQTEAQILVKCPQFITVFVDAVNGLLEKCPYYKLASKIKVKIIHEIYNFLIACLRCGKFYHALSELRSIIVFSCIFKTLAFSPQDYENYYNDPEQFVNSLFQIVELDAGFLVGNEKPEMDDEVLDIQIFDTLKTHSANLLKNYVKYIDGSIAQISFYLINVIDDKINLELSKNLMFLLLCVLRDELRTRTDFLYKVKKVVFKNLTDLEVPVKSVEQPYSNKNGNFIDVEYSLTMFTLNQFLVLFNTLIEDSNSLDKTFQICQRLLKNDKIEPVPKIFAAELLFTILDKTEESSIYARRAIELLNQIMSAKKLSVRYLQCILQIVKENAAVFKKDYSMLIEMIEKISSYLVNELSKQNKNVEIASMLWHIFEELANSKELGILLVDTLKRTTQPLINLINGENQIELEEKVYNLMEKIIKITGGIGQFELQILSILPKTFYTGRKKRTLSTCFSLLQLIILYGKQGLTANLTTTKNLIILCIDAITSKSVNEVMRNETESLEGIFIIQSLVISMGTHFTQEMWVTITTCLANKLRNELLVYDFVRASIVSTLSLVISMASSCFSPSDSQELMKLLMKNLDCLTYYEPMRLFIIAMSNLLQQPNLHLVSSRYAYLLDCTVTLLKQTIAVKPTSSSEAEEMDSEHKHYLKLVKSVRNSYEGVDQFECFKMAISIIKDSNRALLEAALSELPEVKQTYFKNLLSMRKVGEHSRIIYKMKNTQKIENTTM